jgi:hypothetical protein
MSAGTPRPQSTSPTVQEQEAQRAHKRNTSPGGPLDRHIQASSGENGQTSSGEHGDGPGSNHYRLMNEEHKHEGAAGDSVEMVAAVSKGLKGVAVEKAGNADAVAGVLECHEPRVGGEGKCVRLTSGSHDGGTKTRDTRDTSDAEPSAAFAEAAIILQRGAPSDLMRPEATLAADGTSRADDGTPTVPKVQTPQPAGTPPPGHDLPHPPSAQFLLRQAMSTRQLQSKYEEVFGVPTKVHNKDWILSKISERVTLEVPAAKPPAQPGTKSPLKRAQNPGSAGGGAAGGKVSDKQGVSEASRKHGGGGGAKAAAVDIPAGQMRCSRNDGKNWRCSETATAGHKHCLKHMRWSVGGRGAAGKQQGQGQERGHGQSSTGVKRPRWLSAIDSADGGRPPPVGMPFGGPLPHNTLPGAPNPLVAAPLLSAAASALDELHNREDSEAQRHLQRSMGGMMPPAFGFSGWPGVPQLGLNPGAPGPPAAPLVAFPGAATYRPTPTKMPFVFDSLIAPGTTTGGIGVSVGGHPAPGSSAAAVDAPAGGSMCTGVDCTVELVPMPVPGTASGSPAERSGGQGGGGGALFGSTVRTTLNLALLTSFDALHCSLATIVGAPPPAGGRHDPSALQIVYCNVNGAPAVLGGESWPVFLSRARSLHARLLVPTEEALNDGGVGAEGVAVHVPGEMSIPALFPAPALASFPTPTLSLTSVPVPAPHQGANPVPFPGMHAHWATMGLDPNIMMAMMMYAAAASAGSSNHNA